MILITGATGLLGTQLVDYLIRSNSVKLRLLIRNESDRKKFTESNRIEFVIGDITDIVSLNAAFENIDYVYHCAGYISFSPFDKKKMNKVNIEGVNNIVNCCLDFNIKKLCHVSSVSAIGKPKNSNVATEESKWDNNEDNSYYGYTKYQGELHVWRGIEEGLKAVIVNPSVILGPTDWDKSSMRIFDYVKKGGKYYSGGGNNFVDVRDVVEIMVKFMNSNIHSERYIIANERISFKKLFDLIAQNFGVKPPSVKAKKWMAEIIWRLEYMRCLILKTSPLITKETVKVAKRNHNYSSEKIQKQLNFKYKPIEETISWVVEKIKP